MNRTFSVSIVVGLNIAIAIGIQFFILLHFGVGPDTDAHVASQTLPVLAGSLLTATLPQALVPILIAERDPGAAAWAILRTMALISVPTVLALVVLTPLLVRALFFGMDEGAQAIAIDLSRIQMPTIVASALLAAPLARLYADHRVLTSEAAFLLASVITAAILPFLSNRYGIRGASVALLVRPFIQFAYVLSAIGRPPSAIRDRELRATVWHRVRPLLGSAPLYKLGPVVDRMLGSLAQTGQLTLLIYGQHVWSFGLTMIDRVFAKPLLANVSRGVFERRFDDARAAYLTHLRNVGILTTIAVAAFWLVGEPALALVSDVTRLTSADAAGLYTICLVLGGVLILGGMAQMSLTVVYSLGDTRSVMRIAIASFIAATAIKVALIQAFGVIGIALGAVFYQLANFVALHRCVMRALR